MRPRAQVPRVRGSFEPPSFEGETHAGSTLTEWTGPADPVERPGGRLPHDVVLVVERAGEGGDGARIAAVAEGDRRVSEESAAPGSQDRAPAEPRAKAVAVQVEQRLEAPERPRRRERGLAPESGLAVPGTDVLAHLTTEDPLPHPPPPV